MEALETVEILLAEDSDADAELIARALFKGHVINKIVRVRDGVEALDFLFAHRRVPAYVRAVT